MAASRSKIDILLNLVPDSPASVLQHLENEPPLASAQDSHGYSLLHAAASYGHVDLLRTLVDKFKVSANIADEDSETPLFYAEAVDVAQALLDLGADLTHKNDDGQTAEDKIEGEGDFPLVAAFLRQKVSGTSSVAAGAEVNRSPQAGQQLSHPPPLPDGIKVNIGTMQEPEGEGPDPEFRRRIEELAAREDFQSEEGQRQLRELVTDAVTGLREDASQDGRAATRRRVDD
jgi:ankyrin repeat protein